MIFHLSWLMKYWLHLITNQLNMIKMIKIEKLLLMIEDDLFKDSLN